MEIITWADFEKIELRVGTVLEALDFPEARKPAYKVKVDFGEFGIKWSSAQITKHYNKEELIGRQIVGVINFPKKQIATFMSEFLVTGFADEYGNIVLTTIDKQVPNGEQTDMNLANYIIGPQTIGIVIYMMAIIMQRFPPKHINRFYGYRMPSAMKNQQTWDEANSYSARRMAGTGIVIFIIGVAITILINWLVTSPKIQTALLVSSFLISGIIPMILVLVATEKHMEKTFNKQDEVR